MREHFNDGVEFAHFLAHRFVTDEALNSAAALTYTTLFAVVPIMTVTFFMFSLIPVFHGTDEPIQTFIFRDFVPSTGEVVETYLKSFTIQTRHLTRVGVIFLAVTAFIMLVTIEKVFNGIWRARQPRQGVGQLLLYWTVFSLGPLLLGAGFAVPTYIASLSLLRSPDALPNVETLLGLMSLAFSVMVFTLPYLAVPNTRIPVHHVLMSGMFITVPFEAAKILFELCMNLFSGHQLIYGVFVTVPILLLQIYLPQMIILLGVMLVYNPSSSRLWWRHSLSKLIVLLGVLRVFHQRQRLGQSLRPTHLHRADWLLSEDEWKELLSFFEKERFVCRADGGRWVLHRDLGTYGLHHLLNRRPWPVSS